MKKVKSDKEKETEKKKDDTPQASDNTEKREFRVTVSELECDDDDDDYDVDLVETRKIVADDMDVMVSVFAGKDKPDGHQPDMDGNAETDVKPDKAVIQSESVKPFEGKPVKGEETVNEEHPAENEQSGELRDTILHNDDKSVGAINDHIDSWVALHLSGFTFRTYQREYIVKTLSSILNGEKINLIQAATGSGKSIMVIIMAGVLDEFYHKRSFILCSDLFLWQQYADAIDSYGLKFGYIKGSKGNYVCGESGEDLQNAACRLARIPYQNLMDFDWSMSNGWTCATTCQYMAERRRAIRSHVTLMTYQLYFHYMNMEMDENPFPERDVVFCDECHNIPNLCQSFGSITLERHYDIPKFNTIFDFAKDRLNIERFADKSINELINPLIDAYKRLFETDNNDKQGIVDGINNLMTVMQDELIPCKTSIQQALGSNGKNTPKKKKRKSKYESIASECAEWVDALMESINSYMNFSNGMTQYLVKTDNKTWIKEKRCVDWPDKPQISLKFAKEDIWVNRFLLRHQKLATVMLSATIGNKYSFDENIGTGMSEQGRSTMFNIPSTFDFTKSPIYILPGYKMSQDSIQSSFPVNAGIINKILTSPRHINEKGIIHTGSYKIAFDLYRSLSEDAKRRVHMYSMSKEKNESLEAYKESYNGVLIGPSLLEGIDLPDDGCRFIIFLKIPYPYLGDNLVRAKCQLFPTWYMSETSNNVIQGIGRGNRNPTDWSTTYILDGCFVRLFQDTAGQYPDEMKARMRFITNN